MDWGAFGRVSGEVEVGDFFVGAAAGTVGRGPPGRRRSAPCRAAAARAHTGARVRRGERVETLLREAGPGDGLLGMLDGAFGHPEG